MAHIVYDGAIDRRRPNSEYYKEILAEIRLTYRVLEDQAGRLERLVQEITTIGAQLSSKMSPEKGSIVNNGFWENVDSYTNQAALLDKSLQKLKINDAGEVRGIDRLSLSELRIASMIKIGMTTDQIAQHLHISPDTVKTHRRNIRRKLDIVGEKNDLASYLGDERR